MGTHPIFESDFDCLTEKMLRRPILKAARPRIISLTSSRIKREDIRYTRDHYWVAPIKNDEYKVGLSDYAQDNYGDVVHVEIAKLDEHVEKDSEIGTAESVKSDATIYAPISGKVLEMNSAIDADKGRPQLINRDPLGKGWILKMKATDPDELSHLLTEEQYDAYLIEEGMTDEDGNPIKDEAN